jgi:hypothetical protein
VQLILSLNKLPAYDFALGTPMMSELKEKAVSLPTVAGGATAIIDL